MSDQKKTDEQEPDGGRRGALGTLVMVGSAAYAGAMAVPAYGFLAGESPKGGAGNENWIRIAQLQALPEGVPTRVKVSGTLRDSFTVTKNMTLGSVWVQRSGNKVSVLQAECPHLGCAIDLTGDKKSFSCPCHTSKFKLDGVADSGPSPRKMDALASRVVDGWLEVDYRRFRQGVTEQVEV